MELRHISDIGALPEEVVWDLISIVPRLRIGRDDLYEYLAKLLYLGHVIIAKEADRIVGIIGFYCNNKESKQGYLSIIAVSERQGRRGVGGALCQEMLAVCQQAGMRSIVANVVSSNDRALSFYRKNGFRPIGSGSDEFRTLVEVKI